MKSLPDRHTLIEELKKKRRDRKLSDFKLARIIGAKSKDGRYPDIELIEMGSYNHLTDIQFGAYAMLFGYSSDVLGALLGKMPRDLQVIYQKNPIAVGSILKNLRYFNEAELSELAKIFVIKRKTSPRIDPAKFDEWWNFMTKNTRVG